MIFEHWEESMILIVIWPSCAMCCIEWGEWGSTCHSQIVMASNKRRFSGLPIYDDPVVLPAIPHPASAKVLKVDTSLDASSTKADEIKLKIDSIQQLQRVYQVPPRNTPTIKLTLIAGMLIPSRRRSSTTHCLKSSA